MPIYEYKCADCGNVFDIFLHSPDSQNVQCPVCGGGKLDRLFSASYTVRTGASASGTTCCGSEERCQAPPCSSDNVCRRDKK